MKIITSPGNYNEVINLFENETDILLLGDNNFCVRNVFDCKLETLKKIINIKPLKTKIWVLVNAFFYEPQIKELEQYLHEISKLNIDRVIFNDLAVAQINYEKKLNLKLHYDPVSLITSYGQFKFYVDNNFLSVSLANELFLPEIKQILEKKPKNLEICLQVHGFVTIMHSRWNLVTNFQDYVEDKDDEYIKNKVINIRESQRKYSNKIYEDQHGTHMFSGYELCLIKYLKQFSELGLDYIWINNIMQKENSNYSSKLLLIYKKAINALKNNKYDEIIDQLYEECKKITSNEITAGFVGGIKDIKHYENV